VLSIEHETDEGDLIDLPDTDLPEPDLAGDDEDL
jgi:hypothetical protein